MNERTKKHPLQPEKKNRNSVSLTLTQTPVTLRVLEAESL